MFKIVTSSPRLALLRSHAGTSLRLLHQTAIRAENSPQGIPPKKTPRRRATQQATSEVETNHDTVYEVESSSAPKVLKRRRARKVEPEATKSTIFEFTITPVNGKGFEGVLILGLLCHKYIAYINKNFK